MLHKILVMILSLLPAIIDLIWVLFNEKISAYLYKKKPEEEAEFMFMYIHRKVIALNFICAVTLLADKLHDVLVNFFMNSFQK